MPTLAPPAFEPLSTTTLVAPRDNPVFLVRSVDQSAHMHGRPLALVLSETAPRPGATHPISAETMAARIESEPTAAGLSGGDTVLRAQAIVVTRQGLVPLDADGQGFRLDIDGAQMQAGEYRVLVRAAGGHFAAWPPRTRRGARTPGRSVSD